jgi:hypothetical protein
MCNALATEVIDYSKADIYKLHNEKMTTQELEHLLALHNEYSGENFALRYF